METDADYLLSVLETIADAHDDPNDVLLDAYAVFVNRIRSQSHLLESCHSGPLPALAPLHLRNIDLVRALRRDIRLAHVDLLSPSTFASRKQYARDSSALCHHALCAITTIFRFPVLYSAFSELDLASLFGDVLDIALADKLPVFNEAKTYSLSLWALTCHRLPFTVIASRRDDIYSALQQSLNSARQPGDVLDGLKAISHTIERHPSAFLDLLFPLLPHVIANLDCKSLDRRLHASITLGKFANALVHRSGLSWATWQSHSHHIISFLQDCSDQSARITNFLSIVRLTLSAEPHTAPPSWILSALASLIILCGPTLFTDTPALHVILQSLAIALTHERSVVRALHPHVWRCFVWIFSRMLSSPENVEPRSISSAFHVIKQEVCGGVGVVLASVLLSNQVPETQSGERGDRVPRALSVIKTMVRTECKHTRREGFIFLCALAGDARARHQVLELTDEIPASDLLTENIIRADWDRLSSIIRSISKVPISIHWPDKGEITPHCKTLLVIWTHLARQVDRKSSHLDLVDLWLSVLSLCSHHFECEQHAVEAADMLKSIVTIVVEFLPSVALGDDHPNWGSWGVHDQLCCLSFIDQLWSAMRRAFATQNLTESAELILTSILKYAFHVLDPSIRTVWGRLCADLMTTASSSFLRDFTNPLLVIRDQRELWGVLATSLSPSEVSLDWRELVKFLAIPVCTWTLSALELETWESLLRTAVTGSGDSVIVVEHIVSQYLQGKAVGEWDSITAILGFLLICAHDNGSSATNALLHMVDVCLTVSYTRAYRSQDVLAHSLQLLKVIRQMMASSPGNVMHILRILDGCICLWIEDHSEVMSDDQFNSVAVPLYCETLKALEALPLSLETLQETESFLASAFSRIPSPAIAPFAFERFWRATYHGRNPFCSNLPPKIRSCLSSFVDAYGGDLADGLPVVTESQSQSINTESWVQSLVADTGKSSTAEGRIGVEITLPDDMVTGNEHTTFLLPSPEEETPQPSILQEHRSRIDATSSEGSMNSPRMPLSPIPRFHSSEDDHSISFTPKRKLAEIDAPQKNSRTSWNTLWSVRQLESEPATRDVTPVDVPRMRSVPPKKTRQVFDGVEVPTFRAITRQNAVGVHEGIVRTGREDPTGPDAVVTPRHKRASQAAVPWSTRSNEDVHDWDNGWMDGTSSEADVDRSLAHALASSPPVSEPQDLFPERSPARVNARSMSPAPLQLAQPRSRLEALRDVYASFADGASQIPLSELVQATQLVHQIGALLTEQMSKKMMDPR